MFKDYRNLLGLLLILMGVMFGLEQLGVINITARDVILTAAYTIGALALFATFFADRTRWWASLVGFILAGLAISNLLEQIAPQIGQRIGGPLLLAIMGLGFITIFFIDRRMWWSIIPGGVLLSLAAVSFLEQARNLPFDPAGVLFIGMGLTFLLLAMVRDGGRRLSWGVFPGVPLLVFGLFISLGGEEIWPILWPVMLIGLGLWLLFSTMRKNKNNSGA